LLVLGAGKLQEHADPGRRHATANLKFALNSPA
jgi:hypothetical protein